MLAPPFFFTGTYSDGFFENRENFLFGDSSIKAGRARLLTNKKNGREPFDFKFYRYIFI